MYFQGVITTSGATLASLQSDIIGILTGSIVSQAGLSANFQAGAVFNSAVASGWSLYDSAAGAAANGVTPKVVRAPYSDDPTKFKNIKIDSLSSTQLNFNGYETWNSATHTGTNPMVVSPVVSSGQYIPLTAGTMVIISASANHFFIGITTSLTATISSYQYFSEYTRDDPWNTVANGYPSWVQSAGASITSNQTAYLTRYYDPATGTDKVSMNVACVGGNISAAPGVVFVGTIGYPAIGVSNINSTAVATLGGSNSTNPLLSSLYLGTDNDKNATKYLFDIACRSLGNSNFPSTGAFLGGNCSSVAQCMFFLYNAATIGDTISVAGNAYQIIGIAAARIALLLG